MGSLCLGKRQPGEVQVGGVSGVRGGMKWSVLAVQSGVRHGGVQGGIFKFNAFVCVSGNGMREVDREGFERPLSWGEGCGVLDC